jgi:adenosyl cobinamide kinase/adenosyl cobinamide phosphate guanylyltransferase
MILVIGGLASGKREYVRKEYGYSDQDIADAVLDDKPVIYNLQDLVARDPAKCTSMAAELMKKQIVICNEVGCGIVPMSQNDRETREAVGRLCIKLAREADKVIRIYSGIPTVIKG